MDNDRLLFVMVSEWMTNGNINEFIEENSDVNRFKLVWHIPNTVVPFTNQSVLIARRRC